MLRHPLLLVCICLVMVFTVYDASAKIRQAGTAENTTSAEASKTVNISKKDAPRSSGKSSIARRVKKSAPKKGVQASVKFKLAKAKDLNGCKYKRSSRDLASLPVIDEEFAETPNSVLAVLSSIPVDGHLSSPFGMRHLSGKTKRVRMHTGIDISTARGTPVFAAAPGVVCFAGRWGAYGRVVEVDHGNGLVTRYAHLDSYTIDEGAKVASGEQIGTVGRSGRTTGANLHFETLVNGKAVNPMMAEMWRQTPEQLAAKRGMYVSGLRSPFKSFN